MAPAAATSTEPHVITRPMMPGFAVEIAGLDLAAASEGVRKNV
jgi:hypothetical protein